MARQLSQNFPWTSNPLIINAPMGGFAGPDLAVEVTKAGGLGLIGAVFSMAELEGNLQKAAMRLQNETEIDCSSLLPVGVGLLPFVAPLDEAIAVLKKYKPCVQWLFAAKEFGDYAVWSERVREVCPHTQIWIQVGSVDAALKVAKLCRPDVFVMQGIDAGGHGFERGASIISLIPEARDALRENGFDNIALVAAGGIVDGRGVASALVLKAEGVVMGTRFLAAKETAVPHPKYREAVLSARDGGQSTVRAKVFDELRGPNIWPPLYDGRGLVTDSYLDHVGGKNIQEIRTLYAEAVKLDHGGFGERGRSTVWVGTGVGMVKEIMPAADIVHEVREDARRAVRQAASML